MMMTKIFQTYQWLQLSIAAVLCTFTFATTGATASAIAVDASQLSLSTLTTSPFKNLNTSLFRNATLVYSAGKKAICITGFLPITASANNTHLLTTGPHDDFETTEFFVRYTQTNSTVVEDLSGAATLVTGTYQIFSKLCLPATSNSSSSNDGNDGIPKTIQILTHGGTLSMDYWDLAAPNNSYVDVAAEAGYATFSYNRLGTSPSSQPDPIQVVQMNIQVEILHQLTLLLRGGNTNQSSLSSSSSSSIGSSSLGNGNGNAFEFETVIGIGHSIGAGITQGITTKYPKDFDAVVLMGHSTSFADAIVGSIGTSMRIARLDGSGRFAGLGFDGYFSLGEGVSPHLYSFYKYPYFDMDIFNSQKAASQCNIFGELWTLASVYIPAPDFTGPVSIINGVNDYFFCRGDCTYPENQVEIALEAFYPAASNGSGTLLVPNAGHNVNAQFGAMEAFEEMIAFLRRNDIF